VDVTLLLRAVGSLAAAAVLLWLSKRRLPCDYPQPFNDLLGAVLMGIAVGRVAYLLGEGIDLLSRPLELIFIRGGIAPIPAAAAGLGYLVWTCRADLLNRMDHLAPAALAGLAVWEGGCWWQGSCLGSPSGLWWSLPLPGSDLTRHPVGMYAAVVLAVGALLLARRPLRGKGETAAAGLSWICAVRLATPLWSVGAWTNWTWWYLVGLLIGSVGMLTLRIRSRGAKERGASG
jgi:prolipoprotein diacylglyceryltransferase